MPFFRKKPVTIEARVVPRVPLMCPTPQNGEIAELAAWCGGTLMSSVTTQAFCVDIPTLEGTMRADAGDFIIRGVKGEFYPCKPDIFAATYDPVET